MKKFHVSVLLALLCSMPVCAMHNGMDSYDEGSDEGASQAHSGSSTSALPDAVSDLIHEVEGVGGYYKAVQGRLPVLIERVHGLAHQANVAIPGQCPGLLGHAREVVIGVAGLPKQAVVGGYSYARQGCTGISNASGSFANKHTTSVAFAKECTIDAAVCAVASKVNPVNRFAAFNNAMQYAFADQDQANLAVLSMLAQGLRNTKSKAVDVALCCGKDFVENIVVAKIKNAAINNVIKPAAARYGVNLPGNKVFNAVADASSWILTRRAVEAGASFAYGKLSNIKLGSKKPESNTEPSEVN